MHDIKTEEVMTTISLGRGGEESEKDLFVL